MAKQKAKGLSEEHLPIRQEEVSAPTLAATRVQTVRMHPDLLKAVKIACAERDLSQQDLMIVSVCKELGIPADKYL